jgi:hypothetical protein
MSWSLERNGKTLLTQIQIDTIDLQDQHSPSAQDHSRRPLHTDDKGHGYHQAAELRHVQHERSAEEHSLSNSWTNVSGLSEEPPSEDDDEVFGNGDRHMEDHMMHQNGGMEDDSDEDGNEEYDDDGGDRMSSSPSISDGGLLHFTWPRRVSSLTPISSFVDDDSIKDISAMSPSTYVVSESSTLSLSPGPPGSPASPEWQEAAGDKSNGVVEQADQEVLPSCSTPFHMSPKNSSAFLQSTSSLSAGFYPLGKLECQHHTSVSLDPEETQSSGSNGYYDEKDFDGVPLLIGDELELFQPRSKLESSPSVMDLSLALEPDRNPFIEKTDTHQRESV